MQLSKLTQSESDNMNIIGFIAMLLVVLMFGVLLLSYITKSSKYLNKIINIVAGLYMVVVVVAAILYFVYRHGKTEIGSESDALIIPMVSIVIGIFVTIIVLVIKSKVLEHITTSMNETTSTIVGTLETSAINLTKTN
jgi:hypothetical protein